MKNLLPLIFLSAFTIFSFGCSKAPGKTGTKFKLSLAAITDINTISNGGAMIWGRSDKGDMFGSVINPGAPLELNLPNAGWSFWTVAWQGDGSGAKFSGLVRCSKNNAVLNGTAVQVNISLNNANCSIPDFSPSVTVNAGVVGFPDISHYECSKLSQHNGVGCGLEITGGVKSVTKRLVLQSFMKPRDAGVQLLGDKIISNCYAADGVFIKEQLPISNGFLPALTILESFYSATDCSEADPKGFRRAAYDFGLFGTARLDTIRFINEGICNPSGIAQAACTAFGGTYSASCSMSISLQKEISQAACTAAGGSYTAMATAKKFEFISTIPDNELCSGPRMDPNNTTPHPFASGTGVLASPYTICNEMQLNKIGLSGATYSSSSFSLASDLNMNRTSILGDMPAPQCLGAKPGANFIPIGGLHDGGCNEVAAINFNGNFNGNYHTISNIRLRAKVNDIGFVRSGGVVTNLTLKHIEVEGLANVGTISGVGSTSLKNIQVIDGEVRGQNYVGGVVGKYSGNTNPISNVHAVNMKVWSESTPASVVGGIVADNNNSASLYIEKSSFEGVLNSSSYNEKIGGLLGSGTSGVNVYISGSYSSGVILGSGTSTSVLGGLVGTVSGVVTVDGSYSKISMGPDYYNATSYPATIGGLVGSASTVTVNDSYYYGSIMFPCRDSANTYCSVGSINFSGATGSNKYASLINPNWYGGNIPADNTVLGTFEGGAAKASLISTGKFVEVGSLLPKLAWESGPCSLLENNASVATQSGTRGGLMNPIVLCNKEQWKEIKNYSALHYVMEDDLSLGEITSADMPVNFSGSLVGKDHIVSGFRSSVTSGDGGLFKAISGKISGVKFMAGFILTSGTTNAGVVGVNNGIIENNTFESVNMTGNAGTMGVIAGINNGSIYLNTVESYIAGLGYNVGLGVGINGSSGTITGVTSRGDIIIQNTSNPVGVGGIAGLNSGVISEVEVDSRITNTSNVNTSSRIGLLVGMNDNLVKDALVSPRTSLMTNTSGAKLGHVFGYSGASSMAKRIIAANDVAVNNYFTEYSHFVVENTGGAQYFNSFALMGGVFQYNSGSPMSTSSCSDLGGGSFTYNVAASFNNDVNFPDGYFVQIPGGSGGMSNRITGSHTDATISISSIPDDFVVPCAANAYTSGLQMYQIKSKPNFVTSGVTSTTSANFKLMATFCPSSAGEVGNYNYACPAGEFDMVEDTIGGIGFNRLLAAHMYWELNGVPPVVRPVWTMSDEGYPRLFIND